MSNKPEQENTELSKLIVENKQTNYLLSQLTSHDLLKAYSSIPRLLWFHLLKGIAFGLGSVLGATVVLSALVYVLSQMEFLPIIGEWVAKIIEIVHKT